MKKFLSIIALMLALLMVAAPMVAAEEADAAPVEGEEEVASTWTAPEGIKIYYAENVEGKTPLLDGTISEGEYGKAYRLENPIPVNNYGSNHQDLEAEPVADPTAVSEYIDVYFAYDENNVYIAIYELGPKAIDIVEGKTDRLVPARANWIFNMGFDLNDLSSYFQMQGYATHKQWAKDEFSYFEFGKKNSSPIAAYDLISEAVIRKTDVATGVDVGFGDLLSSNGNVNYSDGQCSMTMEFKFEKEVVAQALNACYFTDYDTISGAMYFGLSTNQYQRNSEASGQYYKWMGQTDIREKQGNYSDFGIYEGSTREFIFDLIVFGDENTPIEIADPFPVRPETEPPVTEPEVTEPEVTEAPVGGDDVTEAPVTEAPAEGGCGGSVALAGIALVAALGTCTAFVAKKKED